MAAVAPALHAAPPRLRLALVADARRQPRWLVEGFARVASSGFADIAAIVIAGDAPLRRPSLYERIDRWVFGTEPSEPLDLARLPHEAFSSQKQKDGLKGRGIDAVFVLGEVDERLIDEIPTLGVWRYDLDGAREVAEDAELTGARLTVRLADGGPPRVAYESWSRTYALSAARNRAELLYKAGEFALRALREAHRGGRAWLEACPAVEDSRSAGKNSPVPSVTRMAGRIVRRGMEKTLSVEQWFLAFRLGAGRIDAALTGFTAILPPADRDWADPFPIEKQGRYYVFFEERPHAGKGHVAVLEIDAAGRWSAPRRVLERDHHLSYPFLLEHEGRLYMVPEAAESGAVTLYRCAEFPHRWEPEATLIEGTRLADATLLADGDRWWLFANGAPGQGRRFDDELHLFHAPRLHGPWTPHERNPVKSDARSARPAGRLYRRGGELHRPAQVCVPRYGAGLAIQRVVRLSPHDYEERELERIVPVPPLPLLGLHTVNRAGHLTTVDAFTRRRRV